MDYTKPIVVAEIGCNHKGELEIAMELIKLAKECNADYVKFQKRTPKILLSKEQYNAPHPNIWQAYGASYGEHREYLEFNQEQHAELKNYCEKISIGYSTSVWDVTAAREIVELSPNYIKVPSAVNNNYELLKILRDDYQGDVHVSVGMSTHEEEITLITFFEETDCAKDRLNIYSCTSGYPVPFEKICLLEIVRLRSSYENKVNKISFSGHHLGIAVDIAAYTLGAKWIERHFTKDRTWKGTDHAASLEPPGLSKLIRDLNATYMSLKYKNPEILEIEEEQRFKMKFNPELNK